MHARASSVARHRRLLVVAILFFFAIGARAHAAGRFADSPCLTQTGPAATQACDKLAREVSHDIDAVRALGEELEHSGKYDEAAAAYQIALTIHADNRNLLQRLIRARGQARALRMLAGSGSGSGAGAGAPLQQAQVPAPATKAREPARAEAAGEAPPPASEATPSGRYLALVIGNEQYANFTRLRTPIADANAFAELLKKDYAFDVTVLKNASRYQIVSALSRLRREATENDNVLVYYAGHGYLDQSTSRGYWLPVDAERDSVANWLSTSDITDMLAGLQARHALILADSCFSGTLLRSDPTVSLDERHSLLEKLSNLRSRNIMTSGGLEPVNDGGGGKHSVFAAALLKALHDNRQPLEAGRLFVQIRERVALGASQTPQYAPLRNAGHDGGDFIFARRPAAKH
jgi:uncharacterized caspase-like protein